MNIKILNSEKEYASISSLKEKAMCDILAYKLGDDLYRVVKDRFFGSHKNMTLDELMSHIKMAAVR